MKHCLTLFTLVFSLAFVPLAMAEDAGGLQRVQLATRYGAGLDGGV